MRSKNNSSSSSSSNSSKRFYYVNLILSLVLLGLVLFIFPFPQSQSQQEATATPLMIVSLKSSSLSLLRGSSNSNSPTTTKKLNKARTESSSSSSSKSETRRPITTPILLPPLSSLVNGTQVIANAPPSKDLLQPLLDFAIIGHPKTATTTLLHWLSTHPSIKTHDDEIHSLTKNRPADFIRRMYGLQQDSDGSGSSSLPPQVKMLYGYKAPRDLIKPHVLDMISEYWPTTKLIIGLRHPVDWFESFYNYRIEYNHTMLPPEQLIGACTSEMTIDQRRQYYMNIGRKQPTCGVCTDDARFHVHLNMLGKVNVSNLSRPDRRLPNTVFLYDAKQLSSNDDDYGGDGDAIKARFNTFRSDLSNFLGLDELGNSSPPLGPPPFSSHSKEANYNPHHKYPLDICQPQYTELRQVLLQHGKDASEWIIKYFINHPDVTVSSPDYFIQLLSEWEIDPCSDS